MKQEPVPVVLVPVVLAKSHKKKDECWRVERAKAGDVQGTTGVD